MPSIETTMAEPSTQPDIAGNYEIIIAPSKGWLRINWREMWEYRDLLFILVRRDFLSKYKQTVLGPIWFVLQPLLTETHLIPFPFLKVITALFNQLDRLMDKEVVRPHSELLIQSNG